MSNEANTATATDSATAAPVILMSNDETGIGAKGLKLLKSAGDGLNGYRATFSDFEKAAAKVDSIMKKLTEMNGGSPVNLPIIVAGHGDANTMEDLPEWANQNVVVSILGVKKEKATGARALVIFPMPTVDEYMSDSNGANWLTKVADKETAHVAFRHLRNVDAEAGVESLYITAQRMPVSIEAYATEAATGGVDYSGFNAVWSELRKKIKEQVPSVATALPNKSDVIPAIRSKSYAMAEFPDLEEQNVFTWLGGAVVTMIQALDDDTISSEEVEEWLANRETLNIQPKERTKLTSEISLGEFKI